MLDVLSENTSFKVKRNQVLKALLIMITLAASGLWLGYLDDIKNELKFPYSYMSVAAQFIWGGLFWDTIKSIKLIPAEDPVFGKFSSAMKKIGVGLLIFLGVGLLGSTFDPFFKFAAAVIGLFFWSVVYLKTVPSLTLEIQRAVESAEKKIILSAMRDNSG